MKCVYQIRKEPYMGDRRQIWSPHSGARCEQCSSMTPPYLWELLNLLIPTNLMDKSDSYGLPEINLYFILIWTHADHCNHCSNSIHVHCSELLLFSSMMPISV